MSRDGQDFLGVTNTCGPKDSDINKSCTGQAVGKITITPKASRKIYSCQITFKNISLNKDVRFSTSLKVNPIIDAPKPSDSICDRDEAIQGNFDGCNESACLGWGFQYGQISAPIALRVTQTGAKFRVATLKTTTLLKRSDVNALLYAQGCLKSKDLLTGFTFSKREIDNALRATIAKDGSGSTSSFTAEVFTVGDRLLGKQPYQPLSDIDLPRQ